MTYKCNECGYTFEEPKRCYGERLEYFGIPCRESWYGCPSCEGAYSETVKCDCCDEYVIGKYIKTKDGTNYCDECYEVRDISND